jgi:hypothetical protein
MKYLPTSKNVCHQSVPLTVYFKDGEDGNGEKEQET